MRVTTRQARRTFLSGRQLLFLGGLCAMFALVTFLSDGKGFAAQTPSRLKGTLTQKEKTGPIYDPSAAPSESADKETRGARSRRHNDAHGHAFVEPLPGQSADPISVFGPMADPLPVDESDTVVLGNVQSASAFLSEDKNAIYSEFQIAVETVLKSSSSQVVQPNLTVTTFRPGGTYRFPSGRLLTIRYRQRGFPVVGLHYLFFLRENQDTKDFKLLTAYDITGTTVVPLDGREETLSEPSPYDAFTGLDVQAFIAMVKQKIAGC